MPIHQFRTYDIIVDIAPGALALLLPALIIPQHYATTLADVNGILASVILLLAGFLAGRLLHALSGCITRFPSGKEPFRSDDKSLIDLIKHGQNLEPQPDGNDTDTEDTDHDSSESDDPNHPLPDDIDRTVLSKAIKSLQKRMTDEKSDPTAKSIRRYGETLLYDKTTLHHRYEILTTFYRSLAALLLGYTIIYAAYGTIVLATSPQAPFSFLHYYVATLITGFFAITASLRYGTFTDRRNHAFVNDIHRHLTD